MGGGTQVGDGKSNHVSDATGYLYKVGELRSVPSWSYVAYLKDEKVYLRYYHKEPGNPEVQLGTVGWACNNPGSLDYSYKTDPIVRPAALEPEKRGAYAKDPRDRLYRRFAIFPSAPVGLKAIIPVLKVFAKGDKSDADAKTTVEGSLVLFKGNEPDGSDLKLLGKTQAQIDGMTDQEKRKAIRDNYVGNLRLFMAEEVRKSDPTQTDAAVQARVDGIMKEQMIPLDENGDDAGVITRALVKKEGGWYGPEGVTYDRANSRFTSMNRLAYQPPQQKRLDDLLAKQKDVEAEMLTALGYPPPSAG